jgi:hypothetical protein
MSTPIIMATLSIVNYSTDDTHPSRIYLYKIITHEKLGESAVNVRINKG